MSWVFPIALTVVLLMLDLLFPRVRRFMASEGVATLTQVAVVITAAINFDGDVWGVILGATVVLLFLRLTDTFFKPAVVKAAERHIDRRQQ